MRRKKATCPLIRTALALFLAVLLAFDGVPANAVAEAMDSAQDLAAQDEEAQDAAQNDAVDEEGSSPQSHQTPTPDLIARAAEEIRDKSNGQGEKATLEATAKLICVSVAAAQYKAAQKMEGDTPGSALEEAFFLVNDSLGAASLVESISKELGVDCVIVQSENAKTWNLIKVSDVWYHVDVWQRAQGLVAAAKEPGKQEDSREWLLLGELALVEKDENRSEYKVLSERDESADPIVVSEDDYLWDAGTTQEHQDGRENASADDSSESGQREQDARQQEENGEREQAAQEQAAQEQAAQEQAAQEQEAQSQDGQSPEQSVQDPSTEGQENSQAADNDANEADGTAGDQTSSPMQDDAEEELQNVNLTPNNSYEAYVPLGSVGLEGTKNASSLRLHVWLSFDAYGPEVWRDVRYGDTVYVNYNFINSYGNEVYPASSNYTAQMYLTNSLGYNISWNVFNNKSKGCVSKTYTIDEDTGATNTPVGVQKASVQLTGSYTGQCNISWMLNDSSIGYYGPYDQSVMNGTYATFAVYPYSGSNLRYQWYCITPSGGTSYINGATSSTYSVLATSSNSGYKYYCCISNYGNSITTNPATLYTNYRLTYDANGGTGAPASQVKGDGEWIRISTASPTRYGYTFLGWSTSKNATTPEYRAGDWWYENKDLRLYAVWKQDAKSISGCSVSLSTGESAYTGAAIAPTVKVQDGNRVLKLGVDYKVTYSKNVNVGTATVAVTGINGYKDTKNATFRITPASIAKASVSAIAKQQYTAGAIKPQPTLKHGGRTLKLNSDYTLRYENNVMLGTGVVVITGKGNYAGTVKRKFYIVRRDLSGASVSAIGGQLYTGKAISPRPQVKAAGRVLKLNTDYTLKYANNVNVGTATVTIVGKGGYTGSKKVTFKISKGTISKAVIGGYKSSYAYTGAAIKPGVTVTYGKTKLKNGKDYKVTYKNNVNAGTATIVITGLGSYGGTKKVTFKIAKRIVDKASVSGYKPTYTYTRSAIKPAVVVKYGNTNLKNGKDYKVTYENNVNAGTASIVITGMGGYGGTKRVTFNIAKQSIAKAAVGSIGDQTYTGAAIKPTPVVKLGGVTLKNNAEYKLSYKSNVNAGTATVVVTGVGNYAGTVSKAFRIVDGQMYKMRRDTWNFENFNATAPYSYFSDLYPASQAQYLYDDQGWGGQCYGMATSAATIKKYGSPSASSFRYGGSSSSTLYGVGMSWTAAKNIRGTSRTISAKQYVQYCFISQYDQTNLKEMWAHECDITGLIAAAKRATTGGTPIVIDLFDIYYGDMYNGHSVMPLSVKETANQAVIQIYDSNYPASEQTLTFKKQNGVWATMSYTGHSSYNWVSWETPCEDLSRLFAGNGNTAYAVGKYELYSLNNLKGKADDEYTLYRASSDMKITVNGVEYDLSKEAELNHNVIMKATRTTGAGDDEKESLYWIKSNVGEVTFRGIDEDSSVAAASTTGGIEANVSAGAEVSINVSDSSDNSVIISQDNGQDFEIRYFQNSGEKDLDEVVVSGTSAGDVSSTQSGNAIEVSGAQSLGATNDGDEVAEERVSPNATYTVDSTTGELQK